MRNRLFNISPCNVGDWTREHYDIFIATVGFEKRSRYIAEHLSLNAKLKVASAFVDNQLLSFKDNFNFYTKSKFEIHSHSEVDFYKWIHQFLAHNDPDNEAGLRIIIDISSMSRFRIASIVSAIRSCPVNAPLEVDFVYSLSNYSSPSDETSPIIKAGPVIREFAGWSPDPDMPSTAIIGLGYDYGKAIGVVEYVEPGELWVMNPIGGDTKYQKAINEVNQSLLELLPDERIINYNIERPFELFISLESLISGAVILSRPIIIPFGPKIFTLCSLLVATIHHPKVAVWRISSDKYAPPTNRTSNGTIVGIRAYFNPFECSLNENSPAIISL